MTIFIIVALVLIGFVILFFVLRQQVFPEERLPTAEEDPEAFVASCINPKLAEVADTIAKQGGTYDLSKNDSLALTLDGKRIAYLCFTTNYYYPCINQQPMLLEHIKNEIKSSIKRDVDACFSQMVRDLRAANYRVELEGSDFEVMLAPLRIVLQHDRTLTISKADSSQKFESFRTLVRHPVYDLAVVAQEIASQEAEYCNFETVGFGLLYPQFLVSRFRTGDLRMLYQITHKTSGKEFNFAIRGCVIPPGF